MTHTTRTLEIANYIHEALYGGYPYPSKVEVNHSENGTCHSIELIHEGKQIIVEIYEVD